MGWQWAALYALIGITYNVMFIASRVFSFTAGVLGMLGGVVGALFITRLGFPVLAGFLAMLACCAVIGIRHRDRLRAAGPGQSGKASLRAFHFGARADAAAVHRDQVEHGAPALSPADPLGARELPTSASGCLCSDAR